MLCAVVYILQPLSLVEVVIATNFVSGKLHKLSSKVCCNPLYIYIYIITGFIVSLYVIWVRFDGPTI